MSIVKRIVLDVLKPHTPSSLEFARAIADSHEDYQVRITVVEMDEKTETILLEVAGNSVEIEAVQETISSMGGSLHSIDEVEVHSSMKE